MTPSLTPRQVLALYDRYERRYAAPAGVRVEATPHVVRHVGRQDRASWVVWSDLAGADADAVIRGEQAYFGLLGRGFEWKHFDHDLPDDLPARLTAAGFGAEPPEALLALDLQDPPEWLDAPSTVDVREVGRAGLDDLATVLRAVWPEVAEAVLADAAESAADDADGTRLCVAYLDGRPVGAGRSEATPGSPFVGLYAGATLPAYRGRGVYRAMVAARGRLAREHGARFLTVDAGPMSAPILRRLGFVHLTTTTPRPWPAPRPVP